jgi:hypothetical protein
MWLYQKYKFATLLIISLVVLSLYAWWRHEQKLEEIKLNIERARTQKVLLEAGRQSAKIQAEIQKNPQAPNSITQEDSLAPHELSDEAEVAQAKLWLSLPKEKRAIMQTETIDAGLASKNKP